jgi:hypothetical protein
MLCNLAISGVVLGPTEEKKKSMQACSTHILSSVVVINMWTVQQILMAEVRSSHFLSWLLNDAVSIETTLRR